MRRTITTITLTFAIAACAAVCSSSSSAAVSAPVKYARALSAAHGWTMRNGEWPALLELVRPESGWNPCRHYPSTTNCYYAGSNACGIPQANPCPASWRGRLGSTWRAQVEWLVDYVRSRYGSPSHALSVWRWRARVYGVGTY